MCGGTALAFAGALEALSTMATTTARAVNIVWTRFRVAADFYWISTVLATPLPSPPTPPHTHTSVWIKPAVAVSLEQGRGC